MLAVRHLGLGAEQQGPEVQPKAEDAMWQPGKQDD